MSALHDLPAHALLAAYRQRSLSPVEVVADLLAHFSDKVGISLRVLDGGSKRDKETLDLCEQRGVTCMLTGVRHFKH